MYMQAWLLDFMIPNGKYYLADAGFALCDTLLVPYRNVRYHLQEWGGANVWFVKCVCDSLPGLLIITAVQLIKKSYSICAMLKLAMQLSASLEL